MKLIIDIPELFYNNSKKRVSSGIDLPIDKYVANGTPYTERPQGKWDATNETDEFYGRVYKCNQCGNEVLGCGCHNFCTWCGAYMRSTEE